MVELNHSRENLEFYPKSPPRSRVGGPFFHPLMRQLILDLLPENPPSLDNFVPGDNAEALAALFGVSVDYLVAGDEPVSGAVLIEPVDLVGVEAEGQAQLAQVALGAGGLDFQRGDRDYRFHLHVQSPELVGLYQRLEPFDPRQYDFGGILRLSRATNRSTTHEHDSKRPDIRSRAHSQV